MLPFEQVPVILSSAEVQTVRSPGTAWNSAVTPLTPTLNDTPGLSLQKVTRPASSFRLSGRFGNLVVMAPGLLAMSKPVRFEAMQQAGSPGSATGNPAATVTCSAPWQGTNP